MIVRHVFDVLSEVLNVASVPVRVHLGRRSTRVALQRHKFDHDLTLISRRWIAFQNTMAMLTGKLLYNR